MFIVEANIYSQGKPDKNGLSPLIIETLDGTHLPTKSKIVNGTIARNAGLEAGNKYAVQIQQINDSPIYGEQYRVIVLSKLSSSEIKSLGLIKGYKK